LKDLALFRAVCGQLASGCEFDVYLASSFASSFRRSTSIVLQPALVA
jgi:hypothetical protein